MMHVIITDDAGYEGAEASSPEHTCALEAIHLKDAQILAFKAPVGQRVSESVRDLVTGAVQNVMTPEQRGRILIVFLEDGATFEVQGLSTLVRPMRKLIWIKSGWHEAGRLGLQIGQPVDLGQPWVPVLWHDEEDPTFFKLAGIEDA